MIHITFADQSTLSLNPEQTLTFWMHSNLKLAFERSMEQTLSQLATIQVREVAIPTFIALCQQSTCFTVDNAETDYFFTQTIVKISV